METDRPRLTLRGLAGAAVVLAVWGALALALHRRNAVWETQRALWTDALAKAPCRPRAHLSLGFALREERRYEEAIEEYRKGLACAGGDVTMEVQLLRNLGAALIWANRLDEAGEVLQEAVVKVPEDAEILTNLAVVWLAKRDLPLARVFAKRALLASPEQGDAWNALGLVQMEQGDLAAARASLEHAMALDPDAGVRSYNLGKLLDRQGDVAGACDAWRRALEGRLDGATRAQVGALLARCEGPGAAR